MDDIEEEEQKEDSQSHMKRKRTPNNDENFPQKFIINKIKPLTVNQNLTFKAYNSGKNLLLHGTAGTGKTYISLYLALNEIQTGISPYKRLVIVRSVVPSRDMGFLPGSITEKAQIYEDPYFLNVNKLYGRQDAYSVLQTQKGIIEFTTTSFLRGMTFENCIVLFDEYQNTTLHEFSTVVTRIGDNCKLIICGDTNQEDELASRGKNENTVALKIMSKMPSFEVVKFDKSDIVRSGLVREFIEARMECGI